METATKPKQLLADVNRPVSTIYVANLHQYTSKKELKKFCEDNFGPVSAVRIHHKIAMAYAFVTFIDTGDAYKAIFCKRKLFFNGRQLLIDEANSQPTKTVANMAGTSKSQVEYNSPLVCINDDCLHEIFKYLHIVDTVKVASTCTRLRYFVNENIYKKYDKLELKRDEYCAPNITFGFLRTMLQHFGYVVEEIDLHGTAFSDTAGLRHTQTVLQFCPNLHTLRLRFFTFRRRDAILLSKSKISSKVIKVIELHGCDCIDDKWAVVLQNFSELRTLIIISNNEISENLFDKCKNLESLQLIHCGLIRVYEFCNAIGSSLRTLKLLFCEEVDGKVFRMISRNMPNIENLTIEINSLMATNQLYCLTKLDHLKTLFIVCSKCIATFIWMLGNRGLLEELIIYGAVLDATTCETIQKFQQLQTLKLLYPVAENEQMMDIIANAELPALREFCSVACNSITNANLVALITSKRRLATVDILLSISVTFEAVRQIIEVLKSDLAGDRPLLKLNIDTIKIGDEEKKYLNKNRELITFTNVTKCMDLNEIYPDAGDDDDDSDYGDQRFYDLEHYDYELERIAFGNFF